MRLTKASKAIRLTKASTVSRLTTASKAMSLTKTLQFARNQGFSSVQKRIHLSGFLGGGADKYVGWVFKGSEKVNIRK